MILNQLIKIFLTEMPFGQVPALEVDGVTIAQTKVIANFLGKRFGKLNHHADMDLETTFSFWKTFLIKPF